MRLAALALCAALPLSACPLSAPQMHKDGVQAAWKVDGVPISVGRHFAIDVQLCPKSVVLTRVEATMPEHRHGMNYRPSLKPLGDGRWRVEGLMFHMPGRWELRLEVQPVGAAAKQLLDNITLP